MSSESDRLSATCARKLSGLKKLKKRRSDLSVDEAIDRRPAFIYTCWGQKVSHETFANLVLLNKQAIARQRKKIGTASCFQSYDTLLSESHRGYLRPCRQIVDGFSDKFMSVLCLECTAGQGPTSKEMALLQASEMYRSGIYLE